MRERNTVTSVYRPHRRFRLPPLAPRRGSQGTQGTRWALGLLLGLLLSAFAVTAALAQDPSEADPDDPPRMLAFLSAGAPLRLTLDRKLDQSRVAPAYGSLLLGYALGGKCLRHGFGVGASWNVGHEGGYTTPVYAGDQIALMPSYLAYYNLNQDVFSVAHVGIPFLVRGGTSVGVELGVALAYRLFAGSGVFAAVNLDAYGATGFNLLASLELGVVIDYEVLP
jgi:hypothetical protein